MAIDLNDNVSLVEKEAIVLSTAVKIVVDFDTDVSLAEKEQTIILELIGQTKDTAAASACRCLLYHRYNPRSRRLHLGMIILPQSPLPIAPTVAVVSSPDCCQPHSLKGDQSGSRSRDGEEIGGAGQEPTAIRLLPDFLIAIARAPKTRVFFPLRERSPGGDAQPSASRSKGK
ncbi:hypothetical protein B296_00033579 [Ensete ventricosum]|uniref:Uncharacterized protein n=1 Tax=Ensete ventricosum TaxID=4639 RepID=A0A426YII7_ENSVE|nr:hypothetical protein B296_00033579 [Ensete ventricosum]